MISVFSRFQELKEPPDDRTETMLKVYEESPANREADRQDRYRARQQILVRDWCSERFDLLLSITSLFSFS